MKLMTFKSGGSTKLGIAQNGKVIDVAAAAAALGMSAPASMEAAIAGGASTRAQLDAIAAKAAGAGSAPWLLDESGISYGPAVPNPGKIICIGLNYRKHAEESGAAIPTSPVIFSKFNNTIAAPDESVPIPAGMGKEYDYEAELCIVIGKTTRHATVENALSHVYGYCCADDVSVRDLQTRTSQWILGKTMDKHFPIGPYVVTSDEVGDPQKLQITCTVNGERRQNSNTADMIFSCAEIIAYASTYFTLEPGDLITTGTPEGVAMGLPNKPWLVPGDEVVVSIEKLGSLKNTMVG